VDFVEGTRSVVDLVHRIRPLCCFEEEVGFAVVVGVSCSTGLSGIGS